MADLSGPAGRLAPRPLAPRLADMPMAEQAVGMRQTSERQRVRRACMECRVKKVKCNGSEPCARCTSLEIRCEYAEQCFRDGNAIDSSQVDKLEARMASIEYMFHSMFQKLEAIQPAPVVLAVGNQSTHTPVTSAPEVPKNVSKIQQLLDAAAEADDLAPGPSTATSPDEPPPYSSKCGSSPGQPAPETKAEQQQQQTSAQTSAQTSENVHWSASEYYADTFGELDIDCNGQLRYVGIGSTIANVDHCIGLRRHIDRGLKKRGYEPEVPFLTTPEATRLVDGAEHMDSLPPVRLVDVLIGIYAEQLAFLFPITTEQHMQQIHETLRHQQQHLCHSERDNGYGAVFYALLAVAAPLLPADHAVLQGLDDKWRSGHLGALFYNEAMHYVNMPFRGKHDRDGRSRDIVTALGLLSMYLAETGSQAEAWIAVGRAIRNAQDLGLHRSPERLRLPKEERNKRRHIWWCLYILERQLCTALGRPLSIDDQDCDIEVPLTVAGSSAATQRDGVLAGFFASMVHLHRIIGQILKIVNSVRNANAWRNSLSSNSGKLNELRIRVHEANERLQWWARDMVPVAIKTARAGTLLAAKHVALSSFFSAVMLLHRVFMSNPHRPSPLADSQAQLKSAKAATDCIREAAEFVHNVPKSHFLVFHGQYVFVSAVVLLQCVRCSDNTKFVYSALKDVEHAMDVLQSLQAFWHGAKKCRATVEEYLDFTFFVLQGGGKKGVCQFGCHAKDQPTHPPQSSHTPRASHAPGCLVKKRPASGGLREPKRARWSKKDSKHKDKDGQAENDSGSAAESPSDSDPPSFTSLSASSVQAVPSASSCCDSEIILETANDSAACPTSGVDHPAIAAPPTTILPLEQLVDPFTEPSDGRGFDSTIDNFLSAISPGFILQDSFFNGLAGLDFADSETAFFDMDGPQNSFF